MEGWQPGVLVRHRDVAAAFDMPMRDVAKLWRDYLAEIPSQMPSIRRIPVSQVYDLGDREEELLQRRARALASNFGDLKGQLCVVPPATTA